MLRSRFQSLPGAFNARLIPAEKSEPKKKGLKATLSRNFDQVNLLCFSLCRTVELVTPLLFSLFVSCINSLMLLLFAE